jgi:hypothetical protein
MVRPDARRRVAPAMLDPLSDDRSAKAAEWRLRTAVEPLDP